MTEVNAHTSLGDLSGLLASWRLHLEAANLSPRTIRAYTDDAAIFVAFLADKGMPTTAASIHGEHVEALIVAELERTAPASAATRYRSLQQLFNWLDDEGEITSSPMAKMRLRDPGEAGAGALPSSGRAPPTWLRLVRTSGDDRVS